MLCGSVLSCSDGLEKRAQLRAQRPRLQRLEEESDEDEGDGSAKPETMEQAYQGFDVKTFGGEATGAPSPLPLLAPSNRRVAGFLHLNVTEIGVPPQRQYIPVLHL